MNPEKKGTYLENQSTEETTPKAYLKGINGLRCIFIIPVVLSHIIKNLDQFGLDPFILGQRANGQPETLTLGLYGIGIFFGISGFLIPYLLGLERVKRGIIDIKRFYIRKALRIFPIYYVNILFCLLIYHIFAIEFSNWDLMILAIYVVNIPYVFGGELPLLGHYWTVAVEEQFYLVWPWLNKFTNRQLLRFCWILLITFLLIRHALIMSSSEIALLKLMDHVWFQCILIGAIFALYYLDHRAALLKIAENKWVQSICWLLLLIGSFNGLSGTASLDIELTTIAGCLILVNQNSDKVLVKLEYPLFNYIGKLTYGIYIVHNPLIFLCGELISWESISNQPLRHVLVVLTVFGISILVAHLLFKILEKPFLRLKEKRYTYIHGMKA